jgi:lipocalin
MMRYFEAVVGALYATSCPRVDTVERLDMNEFTKHTWYSQMQQEVKYQTKDSFYCVTATYNIEKNRTVPFFHGNVITVYNYADYARVNGQPVNTRNGTLLCARQPNVKEPGKLLVGFCNFPNIICGDYWIIGLGENYEWLVVSGGQPTVRYDDGCTTNQTGLWIFSRTPMMEKIYIQQAFDLLRRKGYTTSKLLHVEQQKCRYTDAFIK